MAVSVPFRLGDAGERLEYGWSRLYREHLMRKLRQSYRRKFERLPSPLDVDVERLRNFWEFDDRITAPLHGFAGADDYYARSSCGRFIPGIDVPTLVIHARDDPFVPADAIPEAALGDNPSIMPVITDHGGHVGFVSGAIPFSPHFWAEDLIADWLADRLG